jgi:hypothetical protein
MVAFFFAVSTGPRKVATPPFVTILTFLAIIERESSLTATLPTVSFAQVKVIMSGGFSAAYQEVLPELERTAGIKVTTRRGPSQGNGPNTIGAQLRRGVPADVVIMSEGLDELIAEGRIVAGTDLDLATNAYRRGRACSSAQTGYQHRRRLQTDAAPRKVCHVYQ